MKFCPFQHPKLTRLFRYLYALKTKSPETVHATYILTGTIEETAPKGAKNSNAFSNDYQPVKILSSPFFSDEASATRQLRSMKLVSEHELEGKCKNYADTHNYVNIEFKKARRPLNLWDQFIYIV